MSDHLPSPGLNPALSSVRIKQFLLLLALDKHGSMRKAADELFVSQPAVSKSLLELESVLGLQLFERTQGGLVATLAGSCAIEHAKGLIRSVRRMKYELDAIQHKRQTLVRIGLIMGAVTGAFCDLMRQASETRHDVLIEAQEGTTAELMPKLQSGELDLVFARAGATSGQSDIASRLMDTEAVCIAARFDHELDSERRYECAELINYPWVGYEAQAPLAALLSGWFEDSVGKSPTIKLRTTSALVTVATLCSTDYLAMMPSSVFKLVCSTDRIKKIKSSFDLSLGDYSAYWHKQSLKLDIIESILMPSPS